MLVRYQISSISIDTRMLLNTQYSHCKQGRLQDLLNINSFKLILSKFKIVLNAYVYKISLITDVALV